MKHPQNIITLSNICRNFETGDTTITVLNNINLTINKGEMIAIMGASGSGKSTLMNIIGCLDTASSGDYYFYDENIAAFDANGLAKLRREHFGFIFQKYHLLNTLTARKNVEIPAMYSGVPSGIRARRAGEILQNLGLENRTDYYPNQLSGGQQQRVSIARALMNGGEIILADEPTGALDSVSGKAVLAHLKNLNAQGHTIIMVTHDASVAQNAERIIEIKDGVIINDRSNSVHPSHDDFILNQSQEHNQKQNQEHNQVSFDINLKQAISKKNNLPLIALYFRLLDALKMALLSMFMQKMRTFLTMLGIIIGIASVVIIIAIGNGSSDKILSDIGGLGTSTLEIYPGSGFGDRNAGRVRSLKPSDAYYLAQQSYVHSVTPTVATNKTLKFGNIAVNVTVSGVGSDFFDVRGYAIKEGVGFDESSEADLRLEAVIDQNTRDALFQKNQNPLGEVIVLGHLPVRIIGVTAPKTSGFGSSANLEVWIPYSSAMKRMLGQSYLRNITIRVNDGIDLSLAETNITEILTRLHGKKDFFMINTDSVRETIETTTGTLTLLVASIAFIALMVGGIGVMNIMLVSVSERTHEIGMRMAVGARKSDIAQQFLIEAIFVCLVGGLIGILLALTLGITLNSFISTFQLRFSTGTMVLAFSCATLIGLVFGYFPAKRAANLAPIEALERS